MTGYNNSMTDLAPELTNSTASSGKKFRWFIVGPVLGVLIAAIAVWGLSVWYATEHEGQIYTGVHVAGVELGGLTPAEAEAVLQEAWYGGELATVTLVDPRTGGEWSYTAVDLGLAPNVSATIDTAMQIGRGESALLQQLQSWYYGYPISPVMLLDEAALVTAVEEIATSVNQLPADAAIEINDTEVQFLAGQVGRLLDKADTHERLLKPLSQQQNARVELLIHETSPRLADASLATAEVQSILSGPITFYLENPLQGLDLTRVTLSEEQLRDWLRVGLRPDESGNYNYHAVIDETALRQWLSQYANQIAREPERARFYFDDPTRQLVLVEPHVNGRELDIEATIARFNEQVTTPNRSVPFVIKEIVPVVHSNATAEELGITELVAERTTWFYGSSAERKHNIARSAANFYGIVVAPGEEFSFNKYLGNISEEDGYKPALIIYGGQTIEGLGGGVCQVSTTLYQASFWGGFDLGSRLAHAYQVGYYNDGEGTGMDATVFSPIVDFTFTNNTEHHLLIENYYNEEYESLTFKIYSTDIGRRVEKSMSYDNVRPPLPDKWEFNPELDYGEIEQVEWAAEGAVVTVERTVYNFAGEVRDQDYLVSNYIPWGNIFQYGAGVDPNNLPSNWRERLDEAHGNINIFDN
jgi:vancomycin resistance protein YoaR